MKKTKRILSCIVVMAMAISTFVLPASANTIALGDTTVVFSQDFNSSIIANPDDTYWKDDSVINASLDGNTNNFFRIWRYSSVPANPTNGLDGTGALYLNQRNNGEYYWLNNGVYEYYQYPSGRSAAWTTIDIPYVKTTASALTTGYYITTFDYYPSIGYEVFYVSGTPGFQDAWTPNNSDVAFNGNTNSLSRAWYKVTITEDLDNEIVWVSIRNASTDEEAYATHWKYTKGLATLKILTDHGSQNEAEFSRPANSAIIDNIKIEKKTFSGGLEPDYIFKQDFEGANPTDTHDNELADAPKVNTNYGGEVYAGTDYGHSDDAENHVLLLSKDHANKGSAQILTDDVKTSGKYKLTYKLYPANGGSVLVIDDDIDNAHAATGTRTNATSPHCLWVFNLDNSTLTRQWYDVELIVDLDNDTETVNIYEEGSSTVFYTRTQGYYANLGIIEFSQAASGPAGRGNSARIDDIEFYEIYSAAPSFTAANVKCYADGDLQANLNKVSPFTDEIEINFPQKIKADTLTANNIYIADSSSNKVTVTSQVVDGKVCTLTPSAALTPGATYTLHIANLANTSGHAMSSEFTQSFTVDALGVVTKIKNVTVGGSEVTAVNQLTGGSTMTVNYSVANSTSSAQNTAVIVAFYNYVNNIPVLVNSGIYTGQVAANTNANSLSQTHTVPTGTFNDVVVMVWDDMISINPLTTALEFKNQ